MERRPRWWYKRGQEDQFDDYTKAEFVAINPHELMENELPAFTRAFRRLFGEDAFLRMTESKLPSKAEEWLESECECGERLYTFLQNLHDNPFALESETDSEDSSDSGNNTEADSTSASDNESGNGNDGDDAPESPSPQPPEAKIAKIETQPGL